MHVVTTFFLLAQYLLVNSQSCNSRDYGNGGTVCVCNSQQCDTLDAIPEITGNDVLIYTSNKEGLRLELTKTSFDNENSNFAESVITVNEDVLYQKIDGFGGCFNDATGINIVALDEDLQQELLKAYFAPEEGIGYNLCRIPMGGTDFSTHPYSYHDNEDPTLSNFTLAEEDHLYKIPLVKKASELSGNLNLFTSTWVAPLWMKTNGKHTGPGAYLKEEYYQTWADYFIKFLDEYHNEGIDFWGITTGNEPSLGIADLKIPSIAWNSSSVQKWIVNNLGPTIRNSSYSDIKLMVLDDQRFFLPNTVKEIFENPIAKDYADGIAVHWYYDKIISAGALTATHNDFPDKFILATEASEGSTLPPHVNLGSWDRGEEYANSVIEDVNHWVTGWVDWSMVLDLEGGPTYIDNFVDSPIIVNATANEFYKQPMYYALGHFSKFVPRFSDKIDVSSLGVPVTAFKKPEGGIVVVILNKKEFESNVTINDSKRGELHLQLSPRSITTLLYL